nr:hypothetical protein [Tanacetum cinerariifolium]
MTSFGYRYNPRYAIKECSSCGTLYTRNCVCSIGTVEDKILVPKPPKNCARCTWCGYLVDGPHCQGCALLRQELEENLVTHSPDFQNTFESSNASTNVVNAPREPYVVKQDNGSFVDEIIFYLNRAPDSPNQFHCFHCKDVLRDGEACKRCTCAKCGSGLGKFQPKNHDYYRKQNFCYDSNSIGFDQSQPQQYTVTHPIFNAHRDLLGSQKKLNMTLTKVTEQITSLTFMCELACQLVQKNLKEKQLEEEQAVKAQNWKFPVCYDDDDDEEGYNSLNDNIILELPPYSAVTPTEPIDSLSMGDEHLDTIPATESNEFIKSRVENLVPNQSESEGENGCDVPAGFT